MTSNCKLSCVAFHIYVSFVGQGKVFRIADEGQEGADKTARGIKNRAHEFTCS